MSGVKVEKIGDWEVAKEAFRLGSSRFGKVVDKAILQEAHWFRKKIVKGITRQNPGGKKFKKLSPSTMMARRATGGFGGTKALIRSGDLRNSITVVKKGGDVFVGVPRSAKGKDGSSLVRLGEIHEFGKGPFAIKVTPKMRRFLGAMFGSKGTGKAGGGTGIIIVKIPKRPFIGPVVAKHGKPAKVKARIRKRLTKLLDGTFGV